MSFSDNELAKTAAIMRTIPNLRAALAVTGTEGSTSLAAYSGKFIYLRSTSGDITLLRSAASPTLVAGVGFIVTDSAWEEVFVNPRGEMTLWHIAGAATNLLIAYDGELT